ncbi:unnamed protein product [Haemonchus placei]|uniref:Protein sleepless n=1 Tax=Haemonchus placei TaxID=6290 RepID=A0A0N4WI54_HAEPC|nr:unnamed protein product [Haemonchus placei]
MAPLSPVSQDVPIMRLAVALAVLSTLNGAWMLNCYHCVSQLPLEGIEKDARLAFKALMFQRYNIPPSHEYCDDASTYDFYYAETQTCDVTDSCVKVSIIQGGVGGATFQLHDHMGSNPAQTHRSLCTIGSDYLDELPWRCIPSDSSDC